MYKHKEQYLIPNTPFSLTNDDGDSTSFPATFLENATPQELEAFEIFWEDDPVYVPADPTPEELRAKWKAERAAQVAAITVTTQAGNTFDGDEVSQGRMARAIIALNAAYATTVNWVLADNTVIEATAAELTEALALAGAAQAAIWIS